MILSSHQISGVEFMFMMWAGLWGGQAGQLPWTTTSNGRWDVTGIIGITVLVNSGFHTGKSLCEKYS
jgi:hypothetical protein